MEHENSHFSGKWVNTLRNQLQLQTSASQPNLWTNAKGTHHNTTIIWLYFATKSSTIHWWQ